MNKHLKYTTAVLLVLIGVVIGALVFSHVDKDRSPKIFGAPSQAVNIVSAKDRPIASLRDLNAAFVEIADAVSPTVVTVFVEQIFKVQQRMSPFSFPFFGEEFFFGPPRRQAPREQEFRQQGLGSGVIVNSEQGYILTNNHVIAKADSIYIRTMDDRTLPAKVIGTDSKTDIAVIQVKASNLRAINLGNSDQLHVGEWVMAIGSPMSANLAHTVTSGIVSAKGRSNVGLADYEDFIQTDAAINPGNSGGALVNLDGELVGINTAIATRSGGFQGIGFAVPINMARHVMESLLKHGKVVRGWLGVSIQDINETMAKAMNLKNTDGALVGDVTPDSPAAKAGIKSGDVILELDGRRVRNTAQLRNEIAGTAPGTTVALKIVRDGKEQTIEVRLAELPSEIAAAGGRQELEALLGFVVSPLRPELAQRYNLDPRSSGVVVTSIDQNSAAFRAGLQEGDLIRSVNRQRVQSVAEFREALKGVKKGDTVLLQVTRSSGSLFIAFAI
ncbi:MAG: DegQ family serine endoprotease [candidate division KSB1 bacterium]|nr:DegQ family serine endoprotease [candidate division KSB1 bacterium]